MALFCRTIVGAFITAAQTQRNWQILAATHVFHSFFLDALYSVKMSVHLLRQFYSATDSCTFTLIWSRHTHTHTHTRLMSDGVL